MFVKADRKITDLGFGNQNHEHLEGALRCYNQALSRLPEGSAVMKTAIIRELKKIDPNTEQTSNFSSNAHRIHDLEVAARENILHNIDYISALEKLNEIYDDITERKVQSMYEDVMMRNTITRLFLLLILELPPARHLPSSIKLLERYSSIEFTDDEFIPESLFNLLQSVTMASLDKDQEAIREAFDQLSCCSYLNQEQRVLLLVLYEKFCGC
jgi:factor VIII intron 22 protein